MARDIGSIVKMSRREGYALHPKAHKILIRRTAKPGQVSLRGGRQKQSQYSMQLREKQKVKRLYGLLEKQFRNIMQEASKQKGQAGVILLQYLEQRADNVIYRAGFASSRKSARQLMTHGQFTLNGHNVNVPSIRLKITDKLEIKPKAAKNNYFKAINELSPAPAEIPSWLKVDRKKLSVEVTSLPTREDAEEGLNEQLIVEFYSR